MSPETPSTRTQIIAYYSAVVGVLVAVWGLAAAARLEHIGFATSGSDALGQYLSAVAVLQGGAPTPPNPEGGHSLWGLSLPLVAAADSLGGLYRMRAVLGATIAPLTAGAALLLAPRGRVGLAAAAAAGVYTAVDPGLVDTLLIAFRGYGGPELLAVSTLGLAAGLRGARWGPALMAVSLVGATGQHPMAAGVAVGALAVSPGLARQVGWRWVGVGVLAGALCAIPRLVWLTQLSNCGAGALECLGRVAAGSSEPDTPISEFLRRAFHDRFRVEGGLPGLGLLLGLAATAIPGAGRSRRVWGLVFALGALVGILLLGLSIASLRPYHLRHLAAPTAAVAAASLARLWPVALAWAAWAGADGLRAPVMHPDPAGAARFDHLATILAPIDRPLRVDAAWFDDPVGLEPAPVVLAAVLQGQDADRFQPSRDATTILLVNGGPGGQLRASGDLPDHAILWEEGDASMVRFPHVGLARAWVDSQDATPVLVGGSFDWAKALHPRELGTAHTNW